MEPGTQDLIQIEELELSARIGVPAEERSTPQRLLVSLALTPKLSFEEMTDELARTVDYAAVAQAAKGFAARSEFRLIESLAAELAAHLLAAFPFRAVRVELRKFVLPGCKHVAAIATRSA